MYKGTIGLDIDGTITVNTHRLEEKIKRYLEGLIEKRWQLIFLTGRTFSFAFPLLASLKGVYAFTVQNGASLYAMPSEKLLSKTYLPLSTLPPLMELFARERRGFLVESGKENGDICYYTTDYLSADEQKYVNFRISISPETWKRVDDFSALPLRDYAVAKYFAPADVANRLAEKITALGYYAVIVISDPFRPGYFLAHINAKGVSKANVLEKFCGKNRPLIAAGDDYNDAEMIQRADVKIVMKNAPEEMHALADILAPPASEEGIIPALEKAMKRVINSSKKIYS